MATFSASDDLEGARFAGANLAGARFVDSFLTDVVLRGVDVNGMDIDAPWLTAEPASLWVNGVDVAPYVEDELNQRFPGRELRRAEDPAGLGEAWAAVERQWAATVGRADPRVVDESVDGEWSFAQTLRHLVMATDLWLRAAVLGVEQPFHPAGLPNAEAEEDGFDLSVFSHPDPSYDEVLAARADRQSVVRDFIAGASPDSLDDQRRNPWAPDREVSVRHCLHVILREEWEHHRFAVRDLERLAAG